MASALLVLLGCSSTHGAPPSIDELSDLAKARNVDALTSLIIGPKRAISPFRVLQTGGPYDGGRYGWTAVEGTAKDGKTYVVFTTKITSQCTGELLFQRVGDKLSYIPEENDLGTRIKDQHLDVEFIPRLKQAKFSNEVILHGDGATGVFVMRMGPQYRVEKLENEGRAPVPFTQLGGVILVPKQGASTFKLNLLYTATVNLPNFGGSISETEATLVNDYWYPMIARQTSPYSVKVTAPKDMEIIASGEKISDQVNDFSRIAKFRMDLPTTYWTAQAGKYTHVAKSIGGRTYHAYGVGYAAQDMKYQADLYDPILRFYEKNFGKYPFSSYGCVISKVYGGGALEAYSYATYGDYIPGEDAHETAHTWFGGIVGNSYMHSLWNESFAVFCEGLFSREVEIGNRDERRLAFMSTPRVGNSWNDTACAQSGVEYGPVASSLGYGKGAYVLQLLEQKLGTETMIKCMKRFVDDRPKDRTAEWEDFEKAVKDTTGNAHREFFDQYIHRKGYVDLQISHVKAAKGKVSGSLDWKVPYAVDTEILIEDAKGQRQILPLTLKGSSFEASTKLVPKLVSIDPWRRMLRKFNPNEHPLSIRFTSGRAYREALHNDWRPEFDKVEAATDLNELAGATLIGSPETWPAMRPLCAKVGFLVKGNKLTYKGTTIDLETQTATAVVPLANGKHCRIALGKSALVPESGRASVSLNDALGRFLRGQTDPKTSGDWTWKF